MSQGFAFTFRFVNHNKKFGSVVINSFITYKNDDAKPLNAEGIKLNEKWMSLRLID